MLCTEFPLPLHQLLHHRFTPSLPPTPGEAMASSTSPPSSPPPSILDTLVKEVGCIVAPVSACMLLVVLLTATLAPSSFDPLPSLPPSPPCLILQEAIVLAPLVAIAVRPQHRVCKYVRVNVYDLNVKQFRFKEEAVLWQ